ncbi:MAG: GAF domain-containing protein, partial [Chloroflexota bacterium]
MAMRTEDNPDGIPLRGGAKRKIETAIALVATVAVGVLVAVDGTIPSAFTTLFFIPIIFVAYRQPLGVAVIVATLASAFSSPAMSLTGVELDDSVMPVLWLGWPAVYLFLAVSLNQWASIQEQRNQLDDTERDLNEVSSRNVRREAELETLSAIHTTIMSGSDETKVLREITSRVAAVCNAKFATIAMPTDTGQTQAVLPVGFPGDAYSRFFPDGGPTGEGVAGWAMLHHRVASSSNVFKDPRYDRMRDFCALIGAVSSAAAPIELEDGRYGALVIAFGEEREFTGEEL